MPKEHLSYGDAKHRRRELSTFRKDVSELNKRITEKLNAQDRLAEIGARLSGDPTLSIANPLEREQTRAELEVEQLWLQLKLGFISQGQQQQLLSREFNKLEKGKPGVYNWLVGTDFHGPTKAQQIRDKWFPPIRIAGFTTKR
jgi:hypothetical protein